MKTTIVLSVMWVCATVATVVFKEPYMMGVALAGTLVYLLFDTEG